MSHNCACRNRLTPELLDEVGRLLEPYRGDSSSLIQVLHKAQNLAGYLPRELQVKVAEELNIPLTRVYGVVSFYSLFTSVPKGRHQINVCAGTACYVRGSREILGKLEEDLGVKPGGTTEDGQYSLGVVRCVGACGLGPVLTVDNDVYARVDTEKIAGIISNYTKE